MNRSLPPHAHVPPRHAAPCPCSAASPTTTASPSSSPATAAASAAAAGGKRGPRGGIHDPFPIKFYRMLDQVRDEGDESIVSWLCHGRAFKIHKPKLFAAAVMPRFFNQSKYTSFQRQLNLYGFSRCCRGRDAGAYHHPCFLRGRPALAKNIVRTKVKGNGHKTMKLHDAEPDFHAMVPPDLHPDGDGRQERGEGREGSSSVGVVPGGGGGRAVAVAVPPPHPPVPRPSPSVVSVDSLPGTAAAAAPPPVPRAVPRPTVVSVNVHANAGWEEQPPPPRPTPAAAPSPSLPQADAAAGYGLAAVNAHAHVPPGPAPGPPPPPSPSTPPSTSTTSHDFVNDLNKSIFVHELAMGCTILCQLRRDTTRFLAADERAY